MRLLARGALCLAALFVSACEAVLGIDFDAVDARRECASKQPTPPPDIVGAGGDAEILALVVAGDFGDETELGYRAMGYDVDAHCTSSNADALCTPPPGVNSDLTDGEQGQDNGVGYMLSTQAAHFGVALVNSSVLDQQMRAGVFAPFGLIRVRGYDGLHEDDQVEVDWFVVTQAERAPGGGFVPELDGSDAWPLVAETVAGEGEGLVSVYRDEAAYVRDYQLVARFPSISLPLANVYFDVEDVVLSAKIVVLPGDPVQTLEQGMLGGWAASSTLVGVIPRMAHVTAGQSLCTDSPIYEQVKTFICGGNDMLLPGSSGTCDATSVGIAFGSVPVQLGPLVPFEQPESPCAPEFEPQNSDCTL